MLPSSLSSLFFHSCFHQQCLLTNYQQSVFGIEMGKKTKVMLVRVVALYEEGEGGGGEEGRRGRGA